MEGSLDIVADKCSTFLNNYQQCIVKNQSNDWHNICKTQREDLTKCADDNVPQLKAVKQSCGHIINDYDACLQKHKNSSDETLEKECVSTLKSLYECTDQVIASFK